MRLYHLSVALAISVGLLIASSASADDLYPPPWRGMPGSTMQAWEFSVETVPGTPVLPDIDLNPIAPALAYPYPGTGQAWTDVWGGRQGIWPLSGTVEVEIPNFDVPNPYKEIWVQLTWAKQVSSSKPVVSLPGYGTVGAIINEVHA